MSRFHRQVVLMLLLASVVTCIGEWFLTMIPIDRCPEYWEFKEFSFSGHIIEKRVRRVHMIVIEYNEGKTYYGAPPNAIYEQLHIGDSVRKEKGSLYLVVSRKDTTLRWSDILYNKECEERKIR